MKIILCVVLVLVALACLYFGLLAAADAEGRGGKLFARLSLAALALVVCAIGMWFI